MIYSKKDVAKKFGISLKTVERKVADGSLPHHEIGSRILFDDGDLNIFWDKCRAKKSDTTVTASAITR